MRPTTTTNRTKPSPAQLVAHLHQSDPGKQIGHLADLLRRSAADEGLLAVRLHPRGRQVSGSASAPVACSSTSASFLIGLERRPGQRRPLDGWLIFANGPPGTRGRPAPERPRRAKLLDLLCVSAPPTRPTPPNRPDRFRQLSTLVWSPPRLAERGHCCRRCFHATFVASAPAACSPPPPPRWPIFRRPFRRP
jgi:hypothetical protein